MIPAVIIVAAARAAHEANRAFCLSHDDESQPSWEDAPAWQRESAIAGARAVARNPWLTPEQSHEGWLAHKRADGWRFGPENAAAKTHPCMLPYSELPPHQRAKDALFFCVVRDLLAAASV